MHIEQCVVDGEEGIYKMHNTYTMLQSLILGEKKSKQNYGNVLIGKTNRGIDLNTLAYPSIYV